MKGVARFGKFSVVGAMGVAVQLSSLALLNRWMAGRYLWASGVALEVALLHNFVWHTRYTWRDRVCGWAELVRFHASVGLVSMFGNLVMMGVLVRGAGMPVVVANGIAIGCCGVVNFWLGDRWAFSGSGEGKLALTNSDHH